MNCFETLVVPWCWCIWCSTVNEFTQNSVFTLMCCFRFLTLSLHFSVGWKMAFKCWHIEKAVRNLNILVARPIASQMSVNTNFWQRNYLQLFQFFQCILYGTFTIYLSITLLHWHSHFSIHITWLNLVTTEYEFCNRIFLLFIDFAK